MYILVVHVLTDRFLCYYVFMRKRSRFGKKRSKKSFRRGSKVHPKNAMTGSARGGIRL